MRAEKVLYHKDGETAGYIEFYKHIMNHANKLSEILNDLDLIVDHREGLQKLFDALMSCYIEDNITFKKTYKINGYTKNASMALFIEMSRAHFLLMYNTLCSEKIQILEMEESMNDKLSTFSLSKCKSEFWLDDTKKKSIMMYNQSEIIQLLLHLTKRMEEMPCINDALIYTDFEYITNVAFTRHSIFCCQSCSSFSLDMEDMRIQLGTGDVYIPSVRYMMLSSYLFNAIFRRIYYYSQMKDAIEPADDIITEFQTKTFEKWIKSEVLKALGDEGFEDIYGQSFEKSYHFVCDVEWYIFNFPTRPLERGPILDNLRPAERNEYFVGSNLAKDVVMNASLNHRNDIRGKTSRYFILMAIDQYLNNMYRINWKESVLFDNEDIEKMHVTLFKSPFPCICKIVGDYWVFHGDTIYASDNIYKTFLIWLHLIHTKYGGFFGETNLKYLIDTLLVDPMNELEEQFRLPIF